MIGTRRALSRNKRSSFCYGRSSVIGGARTRSTSNAILTPSRIAAVVTVNEPRTPQVDLCTDQQILITFLTKINGLNEKERAFLDMRAGLSVAKRRGLLSGYSLDGAPVRSRLDGDGAATSIVRSVNSSFEDKSRRDQIHRSQYRARERMARDDANCRQGCSRNQQKRTRLARYEMESCVDPVRGQEPHAGHEIARMRITPCGARPVFSEMANRPRHGQAVVRHRHPNKTDSTQGSPFSPSP